MASVIFFTKSLNRLITYNNSVRPHKIAQVNTLHALYDILVIQIFGLFIKSLRHIFSGDFEGQLSHILLL